MKNPNANRVVLFAAFVWAASLFAVPFLLGLIFRGINRAFNFQLDPYFEGSLYNWLLGPAAGGVVAGYLLASLLRQFPALHSINARSSMPIWAAAMFLAVILMFVLGNLFMPTLDDVQPMADNMEQLTARMPPIIPLFANGMVIWLIPGILGGVLLAREIHHCCPKMSSKWIAWITAGWGLGFALGGGASRVAYSLSIWFWYPNFDPGWLITELNIWLSFGVIGLIAGAVGTWSMMRALRSTAF